MMCFRSKRRALLWLLLVPILAVQFGRPRERKESRMPFIKNLVKQLIYLPGRYLA